MNWLCSWLARIFGAEIMVTEKSPRCKITCLNDSNNAAKILQLSGRVMLKLSLLLTHPEFPALLTWQAFQAIVASPCNTFQQE